MGNGRNQVDGVELNNNLVHINFINSPLSNRLIYFLNNKKHLLEDDITEFNNEIINKMAGSRQQRSL